MEDRHTISEPRPVLSESVGADTKDENNSGDDGKLPCWEVDILRDDSVIVDTLVLDSNVLPPRTNKKGKVVWRLPDTIDKLVSVLDSKILCRFWFRKSGMIWSLNLTVLVAIHFTISAFLWNRRSSTHFGYLSGAQEKA